MSVSERYHFHPHSPPHTHTHLTAHGGGWGYSNSSVEAIRFSVDTEIVLGGYGLYGGRGQYNADIKVRFTSTRSYIEIHVAHYLY